MNDKLKFYRETLVEMTKEAYRKMPNELKTEEAVEEGELLTKAIMKKVDEFEQEKTNMWSPNYDPSYNMTTTIIDHLGFEGNKQKVNPDFLKTEPVRTIVDNGPQYQANQKPYGTLGEHWKELMVLFDVKYCYGKNWKTAFDTIIKNYKKYKCASTVLIKGSVLDPIADSLGIEFIEDFVKACEKCEE